MDTLAHDIAIAAQTIELVIQAARQQQTDKRAGGPSATQLAALKLLRNKARISTPLPRAWPGWPPGVWPKIVALIQRSVWQVTAWFVQPLAQQHNEFNQAVLKVTQVLANELIEERRERQQQTAELLAVIQALQAQLHDHLPTQPTVADELQSRTVES